MSNKKLNFVKQETLKKLNGDYCIILGERSNGKSYAVKGLCIADAYKNNNKFIYLRRWILDCKDSYCVNYFADVPVSAITDGEYTCIDVWQKKIYLSNVDEKTNKIKHGKLIGYCHALSESTRYKSQAFPDVTNIIYEEFIAEDARYIHNEPDRLEHYVSTIFRLEKHKIYLVGNTISRICPYFRDWELLEYIKKQKQGSIVDYTTDKTTITVYLTDSLNYNSGMFFGNIAKSITAGEYITQKQPHLEKRIREYNDLYQLVVKHNEFSFLCHLLQDKSESNNIIWYIEPKTTPIKDKTRVVSTEFNPSIYYSRNFKGRTENERQIFTMLRDLDKVCFSDNLTGTEFKQIIKEFI